MTLLRLEILRMVRTHRWIAVLGIYLFFGIIGPFTARYINDILANFGGDEIAFEAPDPQPVDGISQFLGNASQLGLLAVVLVAAAALAVDSRPEVAAFIRTKVTHPRQLVLPRFAVVTTTSVASLVAGTAIAWALTGVLIGGLPVGAMTLGTLLGGLYLAFAVAVVAALASVIRTVPAVALSSLGVLLLLPIIGLAPAIEVWLPSHLFAAVAGMVEGASPAEYLRATIVTATATVGLLALAISRFATREL